MTNFIKQSVAWIFIALMKILIVLVAIASSICMATAIEKYQATSVIYWLPIIIAFIGIAGCLLLSFAVQKPMGYLRQMLYE